MSSTRFFVQLHEDKKSFTLVVKADTITKYENVPQEVVHDMASPKSGKTAESVLDEWCETSGTYGVHIETFVATVAHPCGDDWKHKYVNFSAKTLANIIE